MVQLTLSATTVRLTIVENFRGTFEDVWTGNVCSDAITDSCDNSFPFIRKLSLHASARSLVTRGRTADWIPAWLVSRSYDIEDSARTQRINVHRLCLR